MKDGNIHFTGKLPKGDALVVGAQNGTSINIDGTGARRVELGNDTGDTDGALLHDTEIPLDGWLLTLLANVNNRRIDFSDIGITMEGENNFPDFEGMQISIRETTSGRTGKIQRQIEGFDIGCGIDLQNNPRLRFLDDGRIVYSGVPPHTGTTSATGADFTVYGPLAMRMVRQIVPTGANHSGLGNYLFTNEGAAGPVSINIGSGFPGSTITLVVAAPQNFSISGAAQTFRILNQVTAVGGAVTSNQVGSSITFVQYGSDDASWVAISMMGAWSI